VTFACIVGFVGGCAAGAILEWHFGVVAMTAPAVRAFVRLLLGELNEPQSFSFTNYQTGAIYDHFH
jgi:hypothetical protein